MPLGAEEGVLDVLNCGDVLSAIPAARIKHIVLGVILDGQRKQTVPFQKLETKHSEWAGTYQQAMCRGKLFFKLSL